MKKLWKNGPAPPYTLDQINPKELLSFNIYKSPNVFFGPLPIEDKQ